MSTNIVVESYYIADSSNIILDKDKSKEKNEETNNNNNLPKITYDITEFEKIIGKHGHQADTVKELKCLVLISLGSDNKLIFYDKNLKTIDEKNIRTWIYSISEQDISSKKEDPDNFRILCCTKDEIKCLSNNKFGIVIKDTFRVDSYICLTFQEESIITNKNGITIKNHLLSKIKFDDKPKMKQPNFHYPTPHFDIPYHPGMDGPSFDNPSHHLPHKLHHHHHEDFNKYYYKQMMHYNHIRSHDFLMEHQNKEKIIENKTYKLGIKINDKVYAFASNAIDIKGENKVILYSRIKRIIIYEVENYSISLTSNSLCSFPSLDKNLNHILLLCGCKKYYKSQKNGILLIKGDIDNSNYKHIFYNTGNFEVFCFCPILIVTNTNYIFKNDREITNTNYFLAGGFQKNKRKGVIKLFKVIQNEKFLDTEIEYIQDIEIQPKDKFRGFNSPISCITQTKYTGNLLVACWDGNIYSLSPPKMDWFTFNEKKINNRIKL